jgi:excisionase family DNA binding protein
MTKEIRYISDKEVAKIIGFGLSTVRNMRSQGRGPAYSKTGRSVRYLFDDVVAYMEDKKIQPRNA